MGENYSKLFNNLKAYIAENKSISYEVLEHRLSGKERYRWVGGRIKEGFLYGIPNHEKRVLKYNTDSYEAEYLGNLSGESYKWSGDILHENILYGLPRSSNNLLAVHLDSGEISEISLNTEYLSEHHYGGICTSAGIIYQPPRNNNYFLKIDLSRKCIDKMYVMGLNANSRYCGSIIHPNGYAYFLPERNEKVIKMNLQTEKFEFIGKEICSMCFDAKVACNGNIYGYSASMNGILKIDVSSDTCEMMHSDICFESYGTKMGVNGKLYSLPGKGQYVWEYEPEKDELNPIFDLQESGSAKFAGGGIDKNGRIFAVPVHANKILEFRPKTKCNRIPNDIYGSFFEDCY